MIFFWRKNRVREEDIQAVRDDTLRKIEKTNVGLRKLDNTLDNPRLGVTEAIFYATGGAKRK